MSYKTTRRLLAYLLLSLCFGALVCVFGVRDLRAQAETGQVAGTVTDQSGAVVPNATVTVTSQATAAVRTTQTGAAGEFVVPNLLPATYSVKVEAHNFKTVEQFATIDPGAKVGLDFKLEIGVSTTVVEVAGSAASILVNTETQTVSQTISNQQLMALPIQTISNPYTLALTSGNISEDDPAGRGIGYAINGMRSETTNVLLDGASNNDEFTASYGQSIPIDSVQEYNLLTSDYTAEYGRVGGGVVNLTTKSGTNDFHGSAYEYNRVSGLASNDFYNNAYSIPKGIYDRNEFGYSIGGPVKKDKLYFFQSTEWTRVRSSSPQIAFVADPSLVALAAAATKGFFSARGSSLVPGASTLAVYTRGQLATQGVDPCGGAKAPDPCGALPMSTPMFDEVAYNVPTDAGGGAPQNTYDLVGRGDWNATDKTTVYGRYALYSELDFPGYITNSPYAGYNTGQTSKDNNFVLSMTHTFSPTLVSQSKLVFERLNNLQPLGTNPQGPTIYTNPTSEGSLLGHIIDFPGYNPTSPGTGIPFGGPQNFAEIYEDLSKVHGSHEFRFGGAFTYMQDNRTFAAYGTAGEALSETSGIADVAMDNFLNGTMAQFTGAVNPEGHYPCYNSIGNAFAGDFGIASTPIATPQCTVALPTTQPNFSRSNRYNEGALYAQDSWKVTPRFTLNMGLRWEYFGPQHDTNPNLDSNFYPELSEPNLQLAIANGNVSQTSQSNIGALWKTDYHNFGPRLGFAWDIFGDGKTSLRGGWGISYIRNFGNVTFNVFENPPNFAVVSLFGGPITSSLLGPFSGTSGSIPLGAVELRAVNPDITTAYAHSYNLDLQREVVRNVVVDIGYSGSKGVHLYDIANVNRPGAGNLYLGDPCPTPLDFPACIAPLASSQYTFINYRSDNGFSDYNSLNTRVTIRNVGHSGVNMVANWTWGNAIDNLSDTFSSSSNDVNLGYLDPFDPKLDKGPAQFDNRQRIAISGVWDVPFFKNTHGVFKQVFDGWGFAPIFTARTGNPYTIFDCTMAEFYCPRMMESSPLPTNPQTPIPVGSSALAGTSPIPDTYSILNECQNVVTFAGCAFNSSYVNPLLGYSDWGPYPASMTQRDLFRSPGDWNMDFGVHKNFKLTERVNLEFRGEMFNFFNHSNLYVENESFGGGVVLGSGGAPYVPADFSGHRNIQLAARVTF